MLDALERHDELTLDAPTRALLLSLSPATADRLLAPTRRALLPRGRTTTKPGSLLKHQIPIRTFADWDDDRPGFLEIDLVSHGGESASGEYLHSLGLTDIATQWTECVALPNRGEQAVGAAIAHARTLLPVPVLGLDSDNGGEFINHHLYCYCVREEITFTRCRPYKKNDQCHVEQKNYSIVRQTIGYERYEGDAACIALAMVYRSLRLFTNFFQPSVQLVSKERDGGKVTKRYDVAQTPYQRMLAAPTVKESVKERLRAEYLALNPAALRREIEAGQEALWRLARVRNIDEATNPQEYDLSVRQHGSFADVRCGSSVIPDATFRALSAAMRKSAKTLTTKKAPAMGCLFRNSETGSGGGIRTHDLWVMSPTSCRCSTPRRGSGARAGGGTDQCAGAGRAFGSGAAGCRAHGPPFPGSCPPSTPPALAGGTTGFGMGPGGTPPRSRTRGTPPPPTTVSLHAYTQTAAGERDQIIHRGRGIGATGPGRRGPRPPPPHPGPNTVKPPAPMRTAPLRRLPAFHARPLNPVVCRGACSR